MSMNQAAALGTSLTTVTRVIGALPATVPAPANAAEFNRRAAALVQEEKLRGLVELFEAAQAANFTALSLQGIALTPGALQCLAQALGAVPVAGAPAISKLNLARCGLGVAHAVALQSLLAAGSRLEYLQLNGNPYLANCVVDLLHPLAANKTLLHLNLDDCSLPLESCEALVELCCESKAKGQIVPPRNGTLRSLCLAGNGQHGIGVWPFKEGRGGGLTMPGLRWLDLSRSRLIYKSSGREPIVPDFLQRLPAGLCLHLDHLVLPYGCTQTLVTALAKSGVTVLSIRSCSLEQTLRAQNEEDCLAHLLAIPSLQILDLAGSVNIIKGGMLDDPDEIARLDPQKVFQWIATHPNLKLVKLDPTGEATPLIEHALRFNPAVRQAGLAGVAVLLMKVMGPMLHTAGLVADIAPHVALNLDFATTLTLRAVSREFAEAGVAMPADPSFDWEVLWVGDASADDAQATDTGPTVVEVTAPPDAVSGDVVMAGAVGALAAQATVQNPLMAAVDQANTTMLFAALQAGLRDTDGGILAAARAKASAAPANPVWIRIVNLLERPEHYLALGRPF